MSSQPASMARQVLPEVRTLLQGAMAIFVVTTVIGILNGTDLVEFERNALLTHLHSGTLGWITLGVFAAVFQLFHSGSESQTSSRTAPRVLAPVAILAVTLYVIAFYTTVGIWRPIGGTFMFAVILAVFIWVLRQSGRVTYTIPHLAALAALFTLVVGAVMGVLAGLLLAGSLPSLPGGAILAHGGAMVGGYVILAGMGIAEWKLRPEAKPARQERLGILQVAIIFPGGMLFVIGALLNAEQLLTLNVPLLVVGVILFLIRNGGSVLRQRWAEPASGRLYAISVPFLVINISLLAYLIALLAAANFDFTAVPLGVVLAMDHAVFIGVIANLNFGMIYDASNARQRASGWLEHVLFWGLNIGLVGFLAGLILESAPLKRVSTPLMGTAILVGIVVYSLRIWGRAETPVRSTAAEPTG